MTDVHQNNSPLATIQKIRTPMAAILINENEHSPYIVEGTPPINLATSRTVSKENTDSVSLDDGKLKQYTSETHSDIISDVNLDTSPSLIQFESDNVLATNSQQIQTPTNLYDANETSPDIIEDTPPLLAPPIIIRPRKIVNENLVSTDDSEPEEGTSKTFSHKNTRRLEDLYDNSDDSVADPNWMNPATNTDVVSDASEPEIRTPKKIKTARWHKKKEDTYSRNKQKELRSQCLPYKNYKKVEQRPKAPKPSDCKCKNNCSQNFTEEDRINICKTYWGLANYSRQKDFILMNVSANPPQRVYVNAKRKRTVSRSYSFQLAERKIKVCEKFFKATLCISNGPIIKALTSVGSAGNYEGDDRRGKHEPYNKTKQEDVDFVKQHIQAFPTMESHYCRKTSSKSYLDSTLTISKMYELYEETCRTATKSPVSINVYRKIFCTEYNLDFHKPKKDQCLLCHKYNYAKAQNLPDLAIWQEKYKEHMSLKEQSREDKERDKIRANEDETFNSITIDLQKVLHMPTSNVSLLYYLRKLNVYNATIYEARTPNDGLCYLWSEVDGKKGSDEVGTALFLWIKRLPTTVTEISIFSDTCGGQNRNQYLLCLQLYLVQTTHIEIIEHKYLESGHTHMEVDSIHSAIENQMRLMPVFSMIDLCNVIRLARSTRNKKKGTVVKKPYEPILMNHTDILDLKDLKNNLMQNRSLGTNGEKVQWLKVKCFRFEKKKPNIVLYRYDYKSNYMEMDVSNFKGKTGTCPQTKKLRKRKLNVEAEKEFEYSAYILKKAYSKKLSITKAKKKDLMKMCTEKIIPHELHHWYENLPDKEGPDFLPEDDCSNTEDED